MDLVITDLFRDKPMSVSGTPEEVENQIRRIFPGILDQIPVGDLKGLIWAVNRMHGYSLVIIDSSELPENPPSYKHRPDDADPWVREIDTDYGPPSSR